MSLLKPIAIVCFAFVLVSCNNKEHQNKPEPSSEIILTSDTIKLTKSEEIINKTITAHGGNLFDSAYYSFKFRDNTYYFKNKKNTYEYRKVSKKGDSVIEDILLNNTFSRTINGELITLSDKEIAIGSEAINSVIYFATLPQKLDDKAVNSKYIESTVIKNIDYDVLEITFDKIGGGEDHDDVFYYWINKNTNKIDYLAYSYNVNGGGIRFRSAYNTRVINGITFQDYINYKVETGTPLKNLPHLYESNKLKEVSRIKTEDVIKLN